MTGIKNSNVEVFKKLAQNSRQHCYTKLGKKPKIAIFRCLKNHVKIELEIWNFAGRLDLDQIDRKKSFKFQEYREVGFLEPLFYDRLSWSIYIDICTYRCIDALAVNCSLHSSVCRFKSKKDTAISNHRS